jgi:Tfp pilus assembly PilM family ATPase
VSGKLLPLGIDIGAARARMALVEEMRDKSLRLRAVASRDVPDCSSSRERVHLLGALLDEMLVELGVRERRCVVALGAPHASLRLVRFPKMSWAERLRAARFEAQRFSDVDVASGNARVRVHPHRDESGAYAVGVVRTEAVETVSAILKSARLRAVALDYDGCALRRSISDAEAIIDIGAYRSTVHAYSEEGVVSIALETGGAQVTRGIAEELSIDERSAERRKRILGCAGAGSAARKALALELGGAITRLRERTNIERVAMTGNGARLPGLGADLEDICAVVVETPVPRLLESDAYPEDVIRAAAPDWTLAASLSIWSAA